MIAILGSGFGLYGHLPALASIKGEKILLPLSYIPFLEKRPELYDFENQIVWLKNKTEAISQASTVVLALNPQSQVWWLHRCLKKSNVKNILLEKPLAQCPQQAFQLLNILSASNKNFLINYSFLYLPWAESLRSSLTFCQSGLVKINWSFHAHHFINNIKNWKRYHSLGGGSLRFYGIHLVALLASFGYSEVRSSFLEGASDDEPHKWVAYFNGNSLPECFVEVNTQSETRCFVIGVFGEENQPTYNLNLSDPFESDKLNSDNAQDARVGLLTQVFDQMMCQDSVPTGLYKIVNSLWASIEKQSTLLLALNHEN